ncbi:MAG: hypothetical protein IPM69_12505 [Ignavibacteria bacterium]|nr:hypothetical protein [Ignavibacteria bacterium]
MNIRLLVFGLLLFTSTMSAQVTINLMMSPNPSPYLSDWQSRKETARFVVRNNATQQVQVKISTKVFGGGGTNLLMETQASKMQPITIPPMQTLTFFAEDALPLTAITFYGTANQTTLRTGKIPADNYRICVELTDVSGSQILSPPSCGNFRIESYQPPRLLNVCSDGLTSTAIPLEQASTMTLRWTGITPQYSLGPVFCHVTICEVLPGQTPAQAIMVNQPIIKQVSLLTQLTLTPDMGPLDAGKTYAWVVQSTDGADKPIGEPNGYSNICTFTTRERVLTQCPCVPCFVRILTGSGGTLVGSGPSSPVTAGTELTFTAEVETACPNGCPATILRGTWTVTFTGKDGNIVKATGGGSTINFTPPSDGTIHVELTGYSIYCGNSKVCNCNNASLDITVTGGGSTTDGGGTVDGGGTPTGDGGGKTTTGGGSTTTTLCPCGPCTTNGIIVNGRKLIDKDTINEHAVFGSDYKFELDVTAKCIPGCPPSLTAMWDKVFYDEDGKVLEGSAGFGTSTDFKATPGQLGCLVVKFYDIKLKCGTSGICECPPVTVTVCYFITVTPPPDTTTGKECKPPSLIHEKGSGVSLGLRLDSPETFPYPRAVPIRAIAYDWDWVTVLCPQCLDGKKNSVLRKPVRDQVSSFNWLLTGPGSLNSPADVKEQEEISRLIDSLVAKIATKKATIDSLEKEKVEIPKRLKARQDRAQKQLDDIESLLTTIDKSLKNYEDSLKYLKDERLSAERQKTELDKKISALRTQITSDTAEIARLKLKLENKPTPDELSILAESNAQSKKVTEAEEDLKEAEEKVLTEAKKLELDIQKKLAELEAANLAYQKAKEDLDKTTKTLIRTVVLIAKILSYSEYITRSQDWNVKFSALVTTYFPGDIAVLTASQAAIMKLADSIAFSGLTAKKRKDLGDEFSIKFTALMKTVTDKCAAKSPDKLREDCNAALAIVKTSADAFKSAVEILSKTAITPGVVVIYRTNKKLVDARAEAARKAEEFAKGKAKIYDDALASYGKKIQDLEDKRADAKTTLEKENETLGEVSRKYSDKAAARENEFQANRAGYLDNLQDVQDKVITERAELDDLLVAMNTEAQKIITYDGIILGIERLITQAKKDKKDLEESKIPLKAILTETPTAAVEAVQKQIDIAKSDLAALEAALKEIRAKQAALAVGKKDASGAVVYYIPPPLEEIMKDKETFEKLKTEVTEKEMEFETAKAFKANAQKRLLGELERIAGAMTKLKTAMEEIPELEKEYNAAQAKQTANATAKKLGNLDKENDIADAKALAEKAQADAESKQKSAKTDAINQKKSLDDAKKSKKALDDKSDKKRNDYLKSMSERVLQEKKVAALERTIKESAATIRREQELLKTISKEYLRINGRKDQASFDKNQAEVNKLTAELAAQKDKIAAQNKKITEYVDIAHTLAGEHKTEIKELEKKIEDELKKAVDMSETMNDRKTAEQKLNSTNEKFGSALEKALDAKRRLNSAKADAKFAGSTLDSLKNEPVDNEKYNSLKAETDAAKAALDKAKKDKSDGEKAISDALAAKSSIEKEAKDTYEKAKKELDDKKRELKKFLVGEFNAVTISATLTATADDDVIDGHRSNDDKATQIQTITYTGTRIPVFPEIAATDGLGTSRGGDECPPQLEFLSNGGIAPADPAIAMNEPRTIALIYKKGEPLWKEWPVIPSDAPTLAKDVMLMRADGADADLMRYFCASGKAECKPSPDKKDGIVDVVHLDWSGAGRYINGANFREVLNETPLVASPKCKDKLDYSLIYSASEIAADPPKNGSFKPEQQAGVMVEVPDSLIGSPKSFRALSPHVITGDHKGLDGETVEFSAKLKSGNATKFGFVDANMTMVAGDDPGAKPDFKKITQDGGYSDVLFYFGEGVGEFELTVKWKREGCTEKKFKAKTPLQLQFLRFAGSAPKPAWEAALAIWDGKESPATAAGKMPSPTDKKTAKLYAPTTDAVTGLLDNDRNGVNDVSILFTKKSGKIIIKPKSDTTKLFGIARVTVDSVPSEVGEEARILAKCEDAKIREFCEPKEVEGTYKVSKIKQFKIGFPSMPFVVELQEDATCGTPISGKGKIIAQGPLSKLFNDILSVSIEVDVKDVEFEGCGGADLPIAQSGSATWTGEIHTNVIQGFDLTVTSLGIGAQRTGMIGGHFTHKTAIPDSIIFSANIKGDGNFMCSLENLPELKIKGFALKKGAAIVLDMDETENPEGSGFGGDFQGVIIGSATLVFPEALSKSKEIPTTLAVKDFSIGTGGVSGEATLTSELKMGIGGYSFTAKELTLTFKNNELTTDKFALKGTFEFPQPFDGAINADITLDGEDWKCGLSTEKPVAIPTLGIVFALGEGCGIAKESGIYSLTLNGSIASKDRFGQIDINNLVIKSDGSAKGALKIGKNSVTKVNKGFGFEVKNLEFEFNPPEQKYELTMKGAISFENLGIKTIEGTITVGGGSVFDIQIDSINIERNPVTFRGKFIYNNNEFLAHVDVTIKNLGGGIKGMVIIGTQPIDETRSYSYWYGELEVRAERGIPLGQTGLALLGLGGGVGSNYNPPIGGQKGSPVNVNGGLALKASVTIGDMPTSGKTFAGRLTMVLFPAAGYFSLNGKAWLLNQEESIFGEGQLNMRWDSPARIDGKMRLFVGVLDVKGRVAKFNSEVEFLYAGGKNWYIKSNDISGSVVDRLRFKGEFDVQPSRVHLAGLFTFDFGGETESEGTEKDGDKPAEKKKDILNIEAHLAASAVVDYNKMPEPGETREVGLKMLYAELKFKGNWDVSINIIDLLTKTITSGSIDMKGIVDATEHHLKLTAKADVIAEIPGIFSNWKFEFRDVNLGYETDF